MAMARMESMDAATPVAPGELSIDVTVNASPRVPPAAFDGAALVFIAVEETRLASRLARRAKRAALRRDATNTEKEEFDRQTLEQRSPAIAPLPKGKRRRSAPRRA